MTVPTPPTPVMPPTPPQASDPVNFDARADAFVAWFASGWSYLVALANWITARSNEVQANSNAAVQAAGTASAIAASPAVQGASANAQAAQVAALAAQAYAGQAQAVSPDSPIRLNTTRVTAPFTVPTGYNAHSAGPITVDDGVTVTVSDHSTWSIS